MRCSLHPTTLAYTVTVALFCLLLSAAQRTQQERLVTAQKHKQNWQDLTVNFSMLTNEALANPQLKHTVDSSRLIPPMNAHASTGTSAPSFNIGRTGRQALGHAAASTYAHNA